MDTSAYLMELAQKFQISSFDGDLSALSSDSSLSSARGDSPDDSLADLSQSNLLDSHEQSASAAELSVASPPMPVARRAPALAAASASALSAQPRSTALSSRHDDLRVKHDQLKKNYRKQQEELERTTKQLDECKRNASRDRSELEDRLRSMQHSHSVLESQLQKSTLEFNHALTTKQAELSQALTSLRAAQQQLQDSNPDVLKQIEYVKDDLSDLTISEALYLEYSAIEPQRQTIREYVTTRVFELLRSEKNARESMAKEVEMMRERLIKVEDECERNARERDQIAKLKRSREAEMQSELTHLESLNAKLHDQLTRQSVQISELTSKGEIYDSLRAKASRLEEEYSSLQQKDLLNCVSNKSLLEEREALNAKLFNLEKSIDLLRQDKMYLTKEVDRLTEVYRNAEKDKERLESKVSELKRQKEEMVERLTRVREEHAQSFDERLNAEITRLQSRTQSDLESIRINQRDAYEREIRGLKESRDTLSAECEKLRAQAESAREDYLSLSEEHRRLQSTLESERTEGRTALKLKSFEYERLSLTHEETLSDMRKLKIEHEVLSKKQSVLKSEFYTLQGESQKRILELEASERSLQEKLQTYAQLEYELDMAILNAGGVDEKDSQAAGQIRGIHSMLESLGANVPTANKRRIKQSILLAQQLVAKSRELDVLNKELTELKDRNRDLESELASAKQSLEFVAQPHNYLIHTLQAREEELRASERKATQMARELEAKSDELKRALLLKNQLETDLQRLLASKAQIDEVKAALLRSHANPTGGMHTAASLVDSSAARENRPPQSTTDVPLPKPLEVFRSIAQMHPNDPMHRFAPAAGKGAPTGSIAPIPSPTTLGDSRSRAHSVDSDVVNDQPKPMWFQKLTR